MRSERASSSQHVNSLVGYFAAHRLFKALQKPALTELADAAVERKYLKGHRLFYEGDPPGFVYVVVSGLVALTELDERGHSHPILMFGSDDIFGLAATLLGIPRPTTAIALVDTNLLLVRSDVFERLYRTQPELAHQVTLELCRMLCRSEQTTFRFTRTPVASRLAKFLLEALTNDGTDAKQSPIALSHQDLALLLGTSRETVSRVLARLGRLRIIEVQGQHVIVRRPDELRRLTED